MSFTTISLMTTAVKSCLFFFFAHYLYMFSIFSWVNCLFISFSFAHWTTRVYYLLKKLKHFSMELYSNPLLKKKHTLHEKVATV